MTIKFGDKVKDINTDYIGTVVAKIEYDTGCIQFAVQTKVLKEGKIQHPEYIDEGHLVLVASKEVGKKKKKGAPGGLMRNRLRHDDA